MRPRALTTLLAIAALATPAHADDPASTLGGKAGDATFYTCMTYAGTEDACATAPGSHPSATAIAAYRTSWTHRALGLQYELANDVPFANAPWIGTHNSFNSMAYGYTPSRSDSNQKLTLAEQLEIDVRSVELDVHWVNGEARVCHGTEQHAGCSSEGPLGPHLDEIAAFLKQHRDQVVLLYLEDQIGDPEGYDAVAAELNRAFGAKLYRTTGDKCSHKLPLTLSRKRLLKQGAQVVTVASGCGGGTGETPATAWSRVVFDWSGDVHGESRPREYSDFPGCGKDFDRAKYQSRIVRYFEDSTFVTSSTATAGAAETDDGITPQTAAAMARCGVDLFGLDQLLPGDGRLESLVWSWAKDEPAHGKCATQRRSDARWTATVCSGKRPAACLKRDGRWLVTKRAVKISQAGRACKKRHARVAVPRTGYENQLLRYATPTPAKADSTWLGYRFRRGRWRATAAR
jgi:Phosphatidylinositol-specific phospholipase C, X domain